MKISRRILATGVAFVVTLVACSQNPRLAPQASPPNTWQAPNTPAVAVTVPPTQFDSLDAYKYYSAQHVMRYNTAHTFSGKLPSMLPAIVVLRITVDDAGRMTEVWVQRSRNEEASRVAVASMHRAGILPRPLNLASGPGRSLTYSETFLFNADNRFQLRTLAPIQTAD